MSINTIPCRSSCVTSIADSPVSHSPANTNLSVAESIATATRRKLAWSSTTHTGPCSAVLLNLLGHVAGGSQGVHTTLSQWTRLPGCVVAEEHQHCFYAPVDGVVSGQVELG